MMKITLLTASNSRNAGGVFYSVMYLAKYLCKKAKYAVCIMSYNDHYSDQDIVAYENIPLSIYHVAQLFALRKLGFSYDLFALLKKESPEIIHQQGIWMYYSFASVQYKKRYPGIKTIVTPHGMLDTWAIKRSSFIKKIAGFLYENQNLKRADCIHALCRSEYESIRTFGLKNPVAIIPNGTITPEWQRQPLEKSKRTMLFLGRIHPKKGMKEFITAIHFLQKNNFALLENWIFKIAGWSQGGHSEALQTLVKEYKLEKYFEFSGSLYGTEKEEALKQADVFILPSFSEGMPMAVLEAWAYRLPVIMTDCCNIPEGFARHAAFRIDTEPQLMSEQLETFFRLPQNELYDMGENGYQLVKSHYSWNTVAEMMVQLYDWVLNGGEKPEFVYL
jgi:poly(glycerol-phosphate) alpha-glucosyltransferase